MAVPGRLGSVSWEGFRSPGLESLRRASMASEGGVEEDVIPLAQPTPNDWEPASPERSVPSESPHFADVDLLSPGIELVHLEETTAEQTTTAPEEPAAARNMMMDVAVKFDAKMPARQVKIDVFAKPRAPAAVGPRSKRDFVEQEAELSGSESEEDDDEEGQDADLEELVASDAEAERAERDTDLVAMSALHTSWAMKQEDLMHDHLEGLGQNVVFAEDREDFSEDDLENAPANGARAGRTPRPLSTLTGMPQVRRVRSGQPAEEVVEQRPQRAEMQRRQKIIDQERLKHLEKQGSLASCLSGPVAPKKLFGFAGSKQKSAFANTKPANNVRGSGFTRGTFGTTAAEPAPKPEGEVEVEQVSSEVVKAVLEGPPAKKAKVTAKPEEALKPLPVAPLPTGLHSIFGGAK